MEELHDGAEGGGCRWLWMKRAPERTRLKEEGYGLKAHCRDEDNPILLFLQRGERRKRE